MVITKSKSIHFSLIAFICTLMVAISVMLSSVVVNAETVSNEEFSKAVYDNITGDIRYNDKKYTTSGGGSFKVTDLLTNPGTDGVYLVNETNYNLLTSSAKTEFLTDLNAVAEYTVKDDTSEGYTEESISNWYAILQQQDGVGSKMINMILANTKPDFVTANNIYKPFSGLVGIALGSGSVLILAFLTIVMICDISYITLPPVRLFAGEGGEGGKSGGIKSKLFSHDAIYAVEQAENSNGNGSPKQALGIYFKRRVFMLILLGICLLYLIQGQIFGLVGMILDLVSGFM